MCGIKSSKGCSEDTSHDQDKGIADFARDQVSSISSPNHAESALGSRCQDHLETSRIDLAEAETGAGK